MASFFSRNCARRKRIVSRIPPASPAATMFTYRSPNALGCLRSASARVWPLSTSYTTWRVTSARTLFSVCLDRMSRAWTRGSPALIMVENWRVNTTTSRILTPPPSLKLNLNSLGAARTCTTTRRFLRRWAMTSSRVGRSILSLTRSPLSVRAVYVKSGIAHSLGGGRLAARRHLGRTRRRHAGRHRLLVLERRLANHPQELVRIRRDAQALLLHHFPAHVELVQRVVQRLHPVLLAGLHRRFDLVHLVVADQRADRRRADHDLRRHDPAPDRKSTRLNSSHMSISYAVFCWKKKMGGSARRGRRVPRRGWERLEVRKHKVGANREVAGAALVHAADAVARPRTPGHAQFSQGARRGARDEHDAGLARREDRGHARRGVGGIHRHIDPARFEHTEQGDHGGRRFREEQGDALARPAPDRAEQPRQPIARR